MNEEEHFRFIESTDRKSLHTQIRALVRKAQETISDELAERNRRLKGILEKEDKEFETEFAHKVKNRLDEDIRERQEQLVGIKEQSVKKHKEYVEMKRMQQVMVNCYEIREAIRLREKENNRICLEEQIQENLRKKRRDCERENYWFELNRRRWEDYDRQQKCEDSLKERVQNQINKVLALQVEDHEEKRKLALEEKRQDIIKADALIEELRLEEFDRVHFKDVAEKQKYGEELREEIRRKHCARRAQWEADKAEHYEFMRETQRLEKEAKERIWQRRIDSHRATLEFISYCRRMRALELGIEKMLNDRNDDLFHVDQCCKQNIGERIRVKAEAAKRHYALLRQQVCEEIEAKMREEAYQREVKLIENTFVHPPIPHQVIVCQKKRLFDDLTAQISEMKRIQAEEQRAYEAKLLKAVEDPEVCVQLTAQIMADNADFLPHHPNWRIHACPKDIFVAKPPMAQEEMDKLIAGATIDKCPSPACQRRDCGLMNKLGELALPGRMDPPPAATPTAAAAAEVPPGDGPQRAHKTGFKSCVC